ncbi:DUF1648 domain-containing protein [Lachnospiraceae bacterium WCA-9-b2]|jgi:uncharacterized membrane protein|uniref:DUF1648 domain-containing protein n=1 Tax=Sporofaciens musculi TaxID=2681861 RepID=A0A7X3MM55_9FIRM|nr:SdpI family protein [Sporofaciens musculi]MCI9423459.1 DUF1648 domain-containing protein [Dorea sp.]MXP78767.1 DUF1648 domain-containing protein [Sporofaciens musculi]
MNKKVLIITTSLITLLPILIGILCWNRLPDTVATHFSSDGTPNGFSPKIFAVLGLPALIFIAHLFCAFCTSIDPKYKNISQKMYRLILFICPVCSLVCCAAIYSYALELSIADWLNSMFFMNLLMGLIFFLIGNYLPKCHQNYTVGIKLPWTLADEENWNLTHRFAGRVYALVGILCIVNAFLHLKWILPAVIIVILFVPAAYSLGLYLKSRTKEE